MIKKILGFFLIALGLLLENIGVFGMGATSGQLKAIRGNANNLAFETYMQEHEKSLVIGGSLLTVGLIILVVGLVLVATKTQAQKEKEMELKILKSKSNPE